jgi:hypothetical protein
MDDLASALDALEGVQVEIKQGHKRGELCSTTLLSELDAAQKRVKMAMEGREDEYRTKKAAAWTARSLRKRKSRPGVVRMAKFRSWRTRRQKRLDGDA